MAFSFDKLPQNSAPKDEQRRMKTDAFHEKQKEEKLSETQEEDTARLEKIKLDREAELFNTVSPTMERVLASGKAGPESRARFETLMARAKLMFGDNPEASTPTARAEAWRKENAELGKSDKQIQSLRRAERMQDERWAYKNFENKYLEAYAAHLKVNPFERSRRELFKTKESVELNKLKDEYYAARLNFLRQFEDKKSVEIEEKQEQVYALLREARMKNESISDVEIEDLRTRLEQEFGLPEARQKVKGEVAMERVLLTKNFLEQNNKARAERFSYVQKLGFGKLASTLNRLGSNIQGLMDKVPLKIGPRVGKVLRSVLIASAIVGGTTATTAGSLPVTGVLIALISAKSLAMGVASAAVGEGAGAGYKKFIGQEAQQDAQKKISNYGDLESWTPNDLSKKDKEYKKLESRASEDTLDRKTAWVTSGVTIAAGFLGGRILSSSALENLAPVKELVALVGGGEAEALIEHATSVAGSAEHAAGVVDDAKDAHEHLSTAVHHIANATEAEKSHHYYEGSEHPADIDAREDMLQADITT